MNARNGASLAACQKAAIAPTPVAVAIRIVCDAGESASQRHGGVSPETVFVGYDGGTLLLERDASPGGDQLAKAGYLAPEQIAEGVVDHRADVFAFGVILWELLAGARLFGRTNVSETHKAIAQDPVLDVRDVNPEVPIPVADVLRKALDRNPGVRYGTPFAFCSALTSARAMANLDQATKPDVAQWVAECVPPARSNSGSVRSMQAAAAAPPPPAPALPAPAPSASVPDFDIPGASKRTRSGESPAVQAPGPLAIPTLDLPMAPVRLPSQSSPSLSSPPASSRSPVAPPAASAGAGREISFDDDDDDFDMQIERNIAGSIQPAMAPKTHSSGQHGAVRPRPAGTGLQLGAPSRMEREAADHDYDSPSIGIRIAGYAVAGIVMGGTAFGLIRVAHRAGGRAVTGIAPHAFDGSSAPESGAFALMALVVAIAIGFVGLRLKPHAWALVGSAGAMLLLALAMVTVTLASTGENPTPPDGVLLVPYLLPAAMALLGLGIDGRAARLFADDRLPRRIGSVPVAAIAGVVVFAAYELSRFAR